MLRERIFVGQGFPPERMGQLAGSKLKLDGRKASIGKERRPGAGCFALAQSEVSSPGKAGRQPLAKRGMAAGPLAKATALLAQERREKTLRALEYIQRHQFLYQEGQMAL